VISAACVISHAIMMGTLWIALRAPASGWTPPSGDCAREDQGEPVEHGFPRQTICQGRTLWPFLQRQRSRVMKTLFLSGAYSPNGWHGTYKIRGQVKNRARNRLQGLDETSPLRELLR
jgi:hypothetical protein